MSGERPAKRQRLSLFRHAFDVVIVSQLYGMLGLQDMSRISAVNKQWYEVCGDVWKLIIEKRIGCLLPQLDTTQWWVTDIKKSMAYQQVYDMFMKHPVEVQKDLVHVRTVLKYLDHKRSVDYIKVAEQNMLRSGKLKVKREDLDQLQNNIIFGDMKKKRVHTWDGTDSNSNCDSSIVSFSISNPESKCWVSFKGKCRLEYCHSDNSVSTGIFDVIAEVYDSNGTKVYYDNLISYVCNEECDEDDQDCDNRITVDLRHCYTFKISKEKLEQLSGCLGISDFYSLFVALLIAIAVPWSGVVLNIPKETTELMITSADQVPFLQLHQYVQGIYSKAQLINNLASEMFFAEQQELLTWQDKNTKKYEEIMTLANNIVTLQIDCDKAGNNKTIGYNVDCSSYVQIKSLTDGTVYEMDFYLSGDGFEEEMETYEMRVHINSIDFDFDSDNCINLKEAKKDVEQLMSSLNIQHLSFEDVCDFLVICSGVSQWHTKNGERYTFNQKALYKWSDSVVPDIENHQLHCQ
jgi:hypothetical protein